jgi:hypothetical protein
MLNRIYTLLLLCCLIFALSGSAVCTEKERGKDQYRTTQVELQSQLMSFADRYAVILGQASMRYQRRSRS